MGVDNINIVSRGTGKRGDRKKLPSKDRLLFFPRRVGRTLVPRETDTADLP